MTNPNHPTAASLDSMALAELAELPAEFLGAIQGEVDEAVEFWKRRSKTLASVLERRYGKMAEGARDKAGKDSGTVRLADGDRVVVAKADKEVKWDQDGLAELRSRIIAANEDPSVYLTTKTTLTVSETAYQQWAEKIKRAFEPYRTVKLRHSFTILPEGSK